MELLEFQKRFGNHISRLRKTKTMSAGQLSRLTGMSKSHIRDIEQGKVNACLDSVRRLYLALGNPLDLFDKE